MDENGVVINTSDLLIDMNDEMRDLGTPEQLDAMNYFLKAALVQLATVHPELTDHPPQQNLQKQSVREDISKFC